MFVWNGEFDDELRDEVERLCAEGAREGMRPLFSFHGPPLDRCLALEEWANGYAKVIFSYLGRRPSERTIGMAIILTRKFGPVPLQEYESVE